MTDDLSVRTACQSDIAALDRMFQRSYARLLAPDYPPSVLVFAVPVIGRAQPGLVASGLFYVVEDAVGRLLGAGGWSVEPPGRRPVQPGVGHVRHVATDPDATRRGVGRLLLTHILGMATHRGLTRMHCQSTRTAVPFYTAMGFAAQHGVTVPLPGGIDFPAVFMDRPLG